MRPPHWLACLGHRLERLGDDAIVHHHCNRCAKKGALLLGALAEGALSQERSTAPFWRWYVFT